MSTGIDMGFDSPPPDLPHAGGISLRCICNGSRCLVIVDPGNYCGRISDNRGAASHQGLFSAGVNTSTPGQLGGDDRGRLPYRITTVRITRFRAQ